MTATADRMVISDTRLDPDHFITDGIDLSEPTFSVGDVARFFFARSAHWIRWRESLGHLTLDGEPVAQDRNEDGARTYNLRDVEMMAHALMENKAINGQQLHIALLLVQNEARLWGKLG